jgi:hypothetical protein
MSHTAERVPQFPHASGAGRGAGQSCMEQLASQRQSIAQRCTPPDPQSWVAPGAHWPSPEHVDQLARPVVGSHVLV